jgi:capsular exopolysaccharide synthesis family protein
MKQFAPISTGGRPELPEEDEIDLSKLLSTLWRGKLWILLSAFIACLIGGYYAYAVAVPVYTADSTIALESREQQVMDIENVVTGLSGDQSTINTEIQVMRSRGLIEKLVLDLNLHEDPEFNPYLRTPPRYSLDQAIGYLRELIEDPVPPAPPPSDRAVLDKTINNVLSSISISNVRQSLVFEIQAVTRNPEKSAAIVNRLAELYIDDQIEVKFEKTEQATLWLSERVSELQVELERAQEELKDFSAGANLVDPETLVALNRQIKELRDRRANTAAQAAADQSRLEALRTGLAAGPEAFAEVAGDAALDVVLQRLQEDREGAELAFETRAETLLNRAELEASRTQAQLAALDRSIEEVSAQIETQSTELVQLQQLQREVEANRLLYEAFLSRLKETSIQQGIQQADSRIISFAVVPSGPSAPRKSRMLALSMLLGLLAGAGGVLLHEMMQNTFRAAEELEARTGYSVVGQIPQIPARRRKNVLRYLSSKPNSAAAEAIRSLRTSMLLANLDKPPKVIMSTSSIPGEGKTTQSVALAQNLAGLGAKVLLIEGDLRRRVLSEYLEVKSRYSLLSVLSEDAPLADAVVHDKKLNADVLLGEKCPINAADLFSSDRFSKFIKSLRETYDYVIIDTPPVLAVPDARVIGQSADAILYAVKWDSTSQRQVSEGIKAFESVNLRITGLVLNQIDKRGMKRYGYGDSYGAYQSYYES